jgi:hypothetical protein
MEQFVDPFWFSSIQFIPLNSIYVRSVSVACCLRLDLPNSRIAVYISCRDIAVFVFRKPLFINWTLPYLCLLHEYHVIYSVRYYSRFHVTAVGLGTYYRWIRGHTGTHLYSSILAFAWKHRGKLRKIWGCVLTTNSISRPISMLGVVAEICAGEAIRFEPKLFCKGHHSEIFWILLLQKSCSFAFYMMYSVPIYTT